MYSERARSRSRCATFIVRRHVVHLAEGRASWEGGGAIWSPGERMYTVGESGDLGLDEREKKTWFLLLICGFWLNFGECDVGFEVKRCRGYGLFQ